MEQGIVVGIFNVNFMKFKDGLEEVCLFIDYFQKVLIMGEVFDLGICKVKKKNGELCMQIVNLCDCEYCQYYVQVQYKKFSVKCVDLQFIFFGG